MTLGGYVDSETGDPVVVEASNIIHVKGSPEKAELLAAALGKVAPEIQDSVLLGHHVRDAPGTEYTISTGNFDNAKKAKENGYLAEHNLEYYSINKNNGDIIIFDTDDSGRDNVLGFLNTLEKNNLHQQTKFFLCRSKIYRTKRLRTNYCSRGG